MNWQALAEIDAQSEDGFHLFQGPIAAPLHAPYVAGP